MMRRLGTGRPRPAIYNLLVLAFLALASATTVFAPAPPAFAQSGFEVTGNRRVEAQTIVVFSGLTAGRATTEAEINEAIQRLIATGLFEDVRITRRGGGFLIEVVENPTINQIAIEGNDRIDDETLFGLIALQPRQPYTRSAAEADARLIVEAYSRSGRIQATVEPKIIRLEDNRVDLVYEVSEGRVTEIQRITFSGNQAYSDRRLRRVLESSQAGLFAFIFTSDVYDPDRLELDKQQLRDFYLNRGYIDMQVRSASAELSRERNAFFLAFDIFEGPQYTYGDSFVTTVARGLDPAEFEALIDLRPGDVYSARRVERVVERMTFLAGQSGFAFVEVVPRVTRNPDTLTADIEFELLEGPRVFVERIDIRGNSQTLDRVIRRQFRLVEGDPFNAREVREAENRIRALRYFDRVEIRVREGSAPDRAVITVDVEEAATGNLSFGASFSSSEGLAGTVSLTERNFLGRGQSISIDLSAGADANVFSFSFTEPALFDQDLAAGFRLFYREEDLEESSVDRTRAGFIPFLGFPLSENSRLNLRLNLLSNEQVFLNPDITSPILLREEGKQTTIGAGFTYTLDRRNSPIDPTAGFIFSLNQDFAGIGGDAQYSKTTVRARAYTSVLNEDVVLSAELEGGALVAFNDQSVLSDRFTLGGDSFRGFRRGGIGPRDSCIGCGGNGADVDDTLGGNMFAVARFEASFPIGLPEEYGITGGVFADVGSLWDLYDVAGASGTIDDGFNLRSSVGFSIFWDTAIGPLRFNFARALQKEPGDETESFRITVDTRF